MVGHNVNFAGPGKNFTHIKGANSHLVSKIPHGVKNKCCILISM